MARLTEEMVIARSKQSDLSAIKKLNCWGAELVDVSLLRRMPNVEVLAFSINKIRSLSEFTNCPRLRELYVRKNDIRELNEIRHLRSLAHLTSLWLDENPCTQHPEYRMTVLRNLPNLEKLDNVSVHPDEVSEAMRRGQHIPDSDDEGYPQQENYSQYLRQRSCESSPERETYSRTRHEQGGGEAGGGVPESETSPPPCSSPEESAPAMTRSQYTPRTEEPVLRPSVSAHNVKEYSISNGECRSEHSLHHDPPDRHNEREWWSEREYPSAVMAEHRGFTRRPVARNSNLLSAVLCLVKELDYPSLEVAEMAVRCRMDELANSQ